MASSSGPRTRTLTNPFADVCSGSRYHMRSTPERGRSIVSVAFCCVTRLTSTSGAARRVGHSRNLTWRLGSWATVPTGCGLGGESRRAVRLVGTRIRMVEQRRAAGSSRQAAALPCSNQLLHRAVTEHMALMVRATRRLETFMRWHRHRIVMDLRLTRCNRYGFVKYSTVWSDDIHLSFGSCMGTNSPVGIITESCCREPSHCAAAWNRCAASDTRYCHDA